MIRARTAEAEAGWSLLARETDCDREKTQAHHGSSHAGGDHRATTVTVTQGADQRGHQELRQGVASRQQSQGPSVRCELGQQKGQQREHDALAEAVIEQRQESAQQGRYPEALQCGQHAMETHTPITEVDGSAPCGSW